MYKKCIKRLLDILLSLLVLVLFCWLYLVLAILVRFKLGSPILFKQARPGKNEKIFNLYKFRTMTDKRDADGKLLPDKDRLTKFGNFLRKSSLDELPEFFNILKGDMSFIGPRPLLVEYLPYYTEREKLRHTVRPGLTGLAQVSGRNTVDWDTRFEIDAQYVENLNFLMDLKVIGLTFRTVFGHTDQVAEDTNKVEGNFAQIRKERLEKTGKLK
ncbi:Sugar transferase involved in LPS biosynthesis (colanic, teichoic acid) [Butyrivibrio proteoclasticus]|uniref:Sugar transferase involved in LPS biosynthesis (Colanic, teichoic acid) n=1 Tax=Butyrivibrio proteoclasticus TaxID=43305 RepID=A0A1I5PL56_9FIRM|nr:sugar transferase [Butyrivibrio proteoclasticus]SFP34251.1 Sugar transferase involved in LPS biosynthesis (colanic, teichoic acid) [Butyrivibrio proteoclasticus]